MKRKLSIRRIVLAGSVASSVAIASALIGFLLLLGSMRNDLARNTAALLAQQRAAENILTEVYAQVFAAYSQIDRPGELQSSEFWRHGRVAHSLIQKYLAEPLPRNARIQVERIKELHQQIEVESQRLFDMIRSGEEIQARGRAEQLWVLAGDLNTAISGFLTIQSQQRDVLDKAQSATFRRLVIVSAIVAVLILLAGLTFAGILRRHIVLPLERLSAMAEEVRAGNLSVRLPPQRADEFSAVAESFNKMAEAVEREQRTVRDRNLQLERALHDLKDTQDDLVRQEKLSGLGQMLAGLAHELNNPMAGILGMSENLSLELAELPYPETKEMNSSLVSPLIRESRRARDLVRNLLSFSRASDTTLGTANLSEAIHVAIGLREGAFRNAGKTLAVDIPNDVLVRGETQRLQQVFINLINNSLDAITDGSGAMLSVTAKADDRNVEIVFQDDGPGFEDPDRVFDPFYTTKPAGRGTGLGLALVLQFVTEFGGTVTAENVPGSGARVVICLKQIRNVSVPAISEVEPAPTSGSVAREPLAGKRFLVVDDEVALLAVQKRVLARAGAVVETAASGTEARQILENREFDFVVSDIRMPGEADGLDLIEWIAAARPAMLARVLLVTGDMSVTNEMLHSHLQPEQFLVKPFTIDEYISRLLLLTSRLNSPASA